MADRTPFDQMMAFWKEGQDTFFQAQSDAARSFAEAFAPKPANPMAEAMQNWQKLVGQYAPAWDPSAMMSGFTGFERQRDMYFALFDPSTWMTQAPDQLKSFLSAIAEMPKFADIAMPQVDASNYMADVVDFQTATSEFAAVMQNTWARAYAAFSKKYSLDDLKSGEVTEALEEWMRTANAELLATQASEVFMKAQRDLIRASTALQAKQAEWAEHWAASFQMPTRTEVDDLTKTVTELKREIRALKRKLADT